jgi:hypothetical protein
MQSHITWIRRESDTILQKMAENGVSSQRLLQQSIDSYFDTISHELLLELVGRGVGDVTVMRLIRA